MDSLAFQLTWDAQNVYASLVPARLLLIIIVVLTETWTIRSKTKHLDDIKSTTKTMRKGLESELGCRYTVLLDLPYFNLIKMLTIDPMHKTYT